MTFLGAAGRAAHRFRRVPADTPEGGLGWPPWGCADRSATRSPSSTNAASRARLVGAETPRHVGVLADGNRRWARASGLEDVNDGHRRGAATIVDFLGWCDDAGVEVVTFFLLSTDNLSRPEAELTPLLRIIEDVAMRPGPARPALAAARGGSARGAAAGDGGGAQAGRGGHPGTGRAPRSTWPSATADGGRSPTPSGRCWPSTPSGAPPSRSWSTRSRSSTSPSTSTRAASPIPTW